MTTTEIFLWAIAGAGVWLALHLVLHYSTPIPAFVQRASWNASPRTYARTGPFTILAWGGGIRPRKLLRLRLPQNGCWDEWNEYLARLHETEKTDFRQWVNERGGPFAPKLDKMIGPCKPLNEFVTLDSNPCPQCGTVECGEHHGRILPVRDMGEYRKHMDPNREPCE